MAKLFLIIGAFIIMSATAVFSQNKAPKITPKKYSIEKNELSLVDAINKHRSQKGLGELQLSPSLSFVAHTHLNDIRLNSKDQHGCNLNSWSDKGKWIPCCFDGNQNNLDLMTSKPSEIIGFRGKGYEIVIAAKKGISVSDLEKLWLNSKATQDFIVNKGQWSNRSWQCMGVSIYNGFASIWASEMPDRMSDVAFEKEMAKISNTDLAVNSTPKVTVQETVQQVTKATLPAKKSLVTRGIEINNPVEKTINTDQSAQTKTVKRSETIIEVEQPVKQEKGTSYFLVHSSYSSIQEAANTIESLKKEGFKNLVMIDARGKYRVALGIYTSEAAAKIALRKNYPRFDQLKIYNF
jgi:hypothetical protein